MFNSFLFCFLDEYKSLEPLSVTTQVTGHPASPANPLSGCLVPTAPSAAETVPYIQRPGLDITSATRQHTLSMPKLTRECPQSSKPPSGSKSSRSSPAQQSKAGTGHSESKQQRISRRRGTNGWLPVGEPYEKPVYVVVSWFGRCCSYVFVFNKAQRQRLKCQLNYNVLE